MKDLGISVQNGRYIFYADHFEDLQKAVQIIGWRKGDPVDMVLVAEDEDLVLCNSTTAERFVKASPDDLLDWIFGFREL